MCILNLTVSVRVCFIWQKGIVENVWPTSKIVEPNLILLLNISSLNMLLTVLRCYDMEQLRVPCLLTAMMNTSSACWDLSTQFYQIYTNHYILTVKEYRFRYFRDLFCWFYQKIKQPGEQSWKNIRSRLDHWISFCLWE